MSDIVKKVNKLTNENIKVLNKREHTKASEVYLDVEYHYPEKNETWKGSVPVFYRRTGVFEEDPEGMANVLEEGYDAMHPDKKENWEKNQEKYWSKHNRNVTEKFFFSLKDCEWTCQGCELPDNPNWARRVQDIKEYGYTLATDQKYCDNCEQTKTHLIMTRFPRGGPKGYETISPELRKRIIKVLDYYDVYEDKERRQGLIPDHKFPEIRWDEDTKEENLDEMSDEKIKKKFQLLDNQRNQQKREVCRECFQTGKRGTPFGISFFYEGNAEWSDNVPKLGAEAEEGCIGCGWYDMEKWRKELNKLISNID